MQSEIADTEESNDKDRETSDVDECESSSAGQFIDHVSLFSVQQMEKKIDKVMKFTFNNWLIHSFFFFSSDSRIPSCTNRRVCKVNKFCFSVFLLPMLQISEQNQCSSHFIVIDL